MNEQGSSRYRTGWVIAAAVGLGMLAIGVVHPRVSMPSRDSRVNAAKPQEPPAAAVQASRPRSLAEAPERVQASAQPTTVEPSEQAAPLAQEASTLTRDETASDEQHGRVAEQEQTPEWKTEKTRAISRVVSARAERIEKELAELERAGNVERAAKQRVILARLRQQLTAMNDEIAGYAVAGVTSTR
jgi:hypothetical protein